MKSIKELDSEIALIEGKGHQASIGDIREVRSIIADMVYTSNPVEIPTNNETCTALWLNGQARAKAKLKTGQENVEPTVGVEIKAGEEQVGG